MHWGEEQKAATVKCCSDPNLTGLDLSESSKPKIKAILKSAQADISALIQPHFSISSGGTKQSDNNLHQHCRDIGCEHTVPQTHAGVWREDGASVFAFVNDALID